MELTYDPVDNHYEVIDAGQNANDCPLCGQPADGKTKIGGRYTRRVCETCDLSWWVGYYSDSQALDAQKKRAVRRQRAVGLWLFGRYTPPKTISDTFQLVDNAAISKYWPGDCGEVDPVTIGELAESEALTAEKLIEDARAFRGYYKKDDYPDPYTPKPDFWNMEEENYVRWSAPDDERLGFGVGINADEILSELEDEDEPETAVLDDAREVVTSREAKNGPPLQSMTTITNLWNGYLGDEHPELSVEEGAMLLALLKVGRQRHGDNDLDDWRDLAGYAELGGRAQKEGR